METNPRAVDQLLTSRTAVTARSVCHFTLFRLGLLVYTLQQELLHRQMSVTVALLIVVLLL